MDIDLAQIDDNFTAALEWFVEGDFDPPINELADLDATFKSQGRRIYGLKVGGKISLEVVKVGLWLDKGEVTTHEAKLGEALARLTSDAQLDEYAKALEDAISEISQPDPAGFVSEISDEIDDFGAEFTSAAKGFFGSIGDGIQDALTALVDFGNDVGNSFETGFGKATGVVNDVGNALENGFNDAVDEGEEIIDDIGDGFDDAGDTLEDIGKTICPIC